ncbi:MAG: acyltransferase, partial [Myxococcota bacterium]
MIPHRRLEVDLLKSAGIAAVVVIHSLRNFWHPDFSLSELWIGQMMRFGVPAFLAVSGFLYAIPQASWNSVAPRLRRIGVPYLVASALAIALGLWQGGLNTPPAYLVDALAGAAGSDPSLPRQLVVIALDLVLGNAFGPYYYVFVIGFFVVLTPLLGLLRRSALSLLLLFAFAAQIIFESGVWYWNDFFWHVRNPALWGAYFLTGWWLRVHYQQVEPFVALHRRALVASAAALLICCAALLTFESGGILPHEVIQLTAWLGVYAVLGLLFSSACGRQTRSVWLCGISDLTYTVYLFHLFFLYPLRD